jgi:hypothetical protein
MKCEIKIKSYIYKNGHNQDLTESRKMRGDDNAYRLIEIPEGRDLLKEVSIHKSLY